jgi:hypothetical protein
MRETPGVDRVDERSGIAAMGFLWFSLIDRVASCRRVG